MNLTHSILRAWPLLFLFGCSSNSEEPGPSASSGGSGTIPGAGGSTSGGASGGTTASGGQASGGQSGDGDGSGGAPSSGGSSNMPSGGSPGSGGEATGSGGDAGSGGSPFGRPPVTMCDPPATLKDAGSCNGILVGTALSVSHLNESGFTTAAKEFNYATPENEMKWGNIEPNQNQFSFGQGDQIVSFAQQNGMDVKGHTLVWHMQLPGWVSSLNSESAVRSAMLNHIEKVMEHYKGKVIVWDVVNEASDIDDKSTGTGNPRYRDTIFYRYLGETYIDEAFEKAKQVDPDVKLFYNDFGGDGLNEKSDMIYSIVKGLVERGAPIDGIGMQAHMGRPNPVPSLEDVIANMQRLADLGLEIQISELDINGCDPNVSTADQEAAYHNLVTACVQQPACTAVTAWGISDKYSWVNSFDEAGCNGQSGKALMWDDNYQKKGTYDAMRNALIGH